jgi:cell volume regulation protein A
LPTGFAAGAATIPVVDEGTIFLLTGAVLAASSVVALGAARTGLPVLVAFLALGMLLGSDGPGGIDFDDAELARHVGTIGLVAILYEGGLQTSWRRLREVAVPAALLSTVGVVVTALITAGAAYLAFDLTWLEAVLLGSVVASTDAAAVFAIFRTTNIRRRLARTLEAESGGNDPMAIALTLGLIAWIEHQGSYGLDDLALLVVRQLGLGLVVGVALGALATVLFARIPQVIGAFAPVASVAAAALAFGAADVIGGSGFLAVYIVGLAVGSTPSRHRRQLVAFHEGIAFVAQVVLFVVLGLLVFPHELPHVILPGLALAAALGIVARPVAVWLSTAVGGFSQGERAFLGWAGLRGAVPIVLATFALSSSVPNSNTIFNAVFFVVVVSVIVHGTTLGPFARRLGLITPAPPPAAPLEVSPLAALDLVDFAVSPGDAIDGSAVHELGLPRRTLIAVIERDGDSAPPTGSTVVKAGDRLHVLVPRGNRADLEDVFSRWRRPV